MLYSGHFQLVGLAAGATQAQLIGNAAYSCPLWAIN